MVDRMVLKSRIDDSKVPGIVQALKLMECKRGASTYWQSSAYGKFDAMFVTIDQGELIVRFSAHKHWYHDTEDRLDNSRLFTMTQAEDALMDVIGMFGLSPTTTRVTYYEIGLNLPMQRDPMDYIRMTLQSVGKEMFIDANYEKNRQRTTAKSRNMRKVLKIYDKTFEAKEKGHIVDANVLRLETIYRHQSMVLSTMFDKLWQQKTLRLFLKDWGSLEFERRLAAEKGIKASQMAMASDIMRQGVDTYLATGRALYGERRLTKKQWETRRNFARSWPTLQEKFWMEPSSEEKEYKIKLLEEFEKAKE